MIQLTSAIDLFMSIVSVPMNQEKNRCSMIIITEAKALYSFDWIGPKDSPCGRSLTHYSQWQISKSKYKPLSFPVSKSHYRCASISSKLIHIQSGSKVATYSFNFFTKRRDCNSMAFHCKCYNETLIKSSTIHTPKHFIPH